MALLIRPVNLCTMNIQRAEELRSLAAEEGITLPMPIDAILWFESMGYVVDLITGVASKVEVTAVTPLGRTIDHLMTPAVELIEDADVDALLEEVFGKPGLGVPDSGGFMDHDETDPVDDAYWAGWGDHASGSYSPPKGNIEAQDAYIRGHNDAWAKAKKVAWWRRK